MEFNTDIFKLDRDKNFSVNLVGMKLPTNKDLFFRAKQQEIFQQYETARIFLKETDTDDWNHWFTCNDTNFQGVFELIFTGNIFEAALMYYNIIVDLSWTICYVSAEFAIYQQDKVIDISGMMSIEEAYKKLRNTENAVVNPSNEGNPFQYLKVVCPEYEEAINLIIDFWSKFSNSEIRNLYNYIKHKGKPLYEEVDAFAPGRLLTLHISNEECPVDVRDIQRKVKLKDAIKELKVFDDELLYPYIKKLFELLEIAVNPSPLVF